MWRYGVRESDTPVMPGLPLVRLLLVPVVATRKAAKRKVKKDIQEKLWEWGDWRNMADCKSLGFSECSIEARMMLFGTYLSSAFTSIIPDYYPRPRILRLDKKIKLLHEDDRLLLVYRYIAGASFDDIGHYCKMTVKEVGGELGRIEDCLDAKN